MSHVQSPAASSPRPRPPGAGGRTGWAAGGTFFAGTTLLIAGATAVLEGIAGISKHAVYLATRGDSADTFEVSAWGRVPPVLGVVAVLVGYGVLTGAGVARYAGPAIAALSAVAAVMVLPHQPVRSFVTIAVDVFVIRSPAAIHPGAARAGGGLL
jgi:hypothetical protein